jgi:hypothetical protein
MPVSPDQSVSPIIELAREGAFERQMNHLGTNDDNVDAIARERHVIAIKRDATF